MSNDVSSSTPPPSEGQPGFVGRSIRDWTTLRKPAPQWQSIPLGLVCLAGCLAAWYFATLGPGEERIISPVMLPSPEETVDSFKSLWFERALTINTGITLRRVFLGFLLAVSVGIPLGVLAGCFSRAQAFLAPLILFGRNIPLAALIPLTFFFFGIGETQKVMFIFIACLAFIIADVAVAIRDVGTRYVDTAYTLGASRWQIIVKVLVPLALPSVFNSLRLLFGLAFGYIMLAELVKTGDGAGGLGYLINLSQRRGPREHIYLIVLIIPVIALIVDRFLYWIQRELFPHRYGGFGLLNHLVRRTLHAWDDFKQLFRSKPAVEQTEGAE